MMRIGLSIILLLLQISSAQSQQLPETKTTQHQTRSRAVAIPKKYILNYKTNYNRLYPHSESVYLSKVTPLTNGVGVQLNLGSYLPEVAYYLYKTNNNHEHKSVDGKVLIIFNKHAKPKVQYSSTKIRAVTTSGKMSKTYKIDINFYPKEMYAAKGRSEPGWLIIQNTDLLLPTSRVEDWIIQSPTKADKAYAHNKWGQLIDPKQTDIQNAMALAKSLIDDLEPHKGIPSDEMRNIKPFKQYERILAGKDQLWCGNIASIFCYASNALDIPCRVISMNRRNPIQPADNAPYRILLAEGHSTTEIYSKDLNLWVWIDLNFHILGAYLGNEGPMNMAELYHNLNASERREHLQIIVYYPQKKTDKSIPLRESDKLPTLMNYFKQDQEFHYTKWNTKSK